MIRSVSIIGAGTMGGGIALTTIKAGLQTCVIDLSPEALARLDQRLDRHFAREIEKGRMDEGQMRAARNCLTVSGDLAAVAGSDLVIEAVFEDIGVKHDLLSRLQPLLAPEVMIATNTSCLLVSEIGRSGPAAGAALLRPRGSLPHGRGHLDACDTRAGTKPGAGFPDPDRQVAPALQG